MNVNLKFAIQRISIGILAVLFSACSPVKLLNSIIPTDQYSIKENIAYGELERQKLDLYIPNNKGDKPLPVVLFYYGGGWDSGKKENYLFVAEAFTSKGFLTVIPDYRVFPDVKFPEFMRDPVSAGQWIKESIASYGGDPNNIFVVGHSAGAHIGMMLNLNKDYLASVELKPDQFRAFIGLAGPYDFLPLQSKRLKDIFGPEETRWQSQPINFVTGENQPALLMVGLKDDTVWPKNTINLAKAIKDKNGEVEVLEYPSYSHVDMVAKLAKPFRGNSTLLDDMVQFMQQTQQ
ncbi:MAG: alpha/beta hydrolase [Methylophilaceae bacterium]